MKANIIKLTAVGLLAAVVAGVPMCTSAKDTNAPATTEKKETKGKKSSTIPFHGKLKAVDKTAKTISVGEMTIQITSETKISKAGKPATLEDGMVEEDVAGAYKKTDDGKLHATTVRFGAKPEKTEKPEKKDTKKETAQ